MTRFRPKSVCVSWICAMVFFVGCNSGEPTGFVAQGGQIDGFGYEAMWRIGDDRKYKVVHFVFFPKHASEVVVASAGFGREVNTSGICSYPEGLFSDGKQTITGPHRSVFAFKEDHTMLPIPLEDNELADLTPDKIVALPKSKVWTERIRPSLEKEDWTSR